MLSFVLCVSSIHRKRAAKENGSTKTLEVLPSTSDQSERAYDAYVGNWTKKVAHTNLRFASEKLVKQTNRLRNSDHGRSYGKPTRNCQPACIFFTANSHLSLWLLGWFWPFGWVSECEIWSRSYLRHITESLHLNYINDKNSLVVAKLTRFN